MGLRSQWILSGSPELILNYYFKSPLTDTVIPAEGTGLFVFCL